MGHRMKFLKLLTKLHSEESQKTVTVRQDPAPAEIEAVDRGASTSQEPQTSHQTRYGP